MAKMEPDTILRCANSNCLHNQYGYNCSCEIIVIGADSKCALYMPKNKPAPEVKTITKFPDGTEGETTTITI